MNRNLIISSFASLLVAALLLGAADPVQIEGDQEFASKWPIEFSTPQGQVMLFQPTMEDLQGDLLIARAAISLQPAGQEQPIFGVAWFTSNTQLDRMTGTMVIRDVNVTRLRISGAPEGFPQSFPSAVQQVMAAHPVSVPRMLVQQMVQTTRDEAAAAAELATDAPKIIFADRPTIKVQYDGPPQVVEVKDSSLKRVANTPFFVAYEPKSRNYYLKGGGLWFAASDALGPFSRVPGVPTPVSNLATAEDYRDPQTPLTADQINRLSIITATEPTEVIWTDGPAKMGSIVGTNLLYVTNTDADVFKSIDSQQTYVLISGRWYSAPNQNGPWAFMPPEQLPGDFRRIPPNSERADVLAHVPGTHAAQNAVDDTYIPQAAAVDRLDYEQPAITYDGGARFEPIGDLPCSYAVNTTSSVVFVGGGYYACDNAVWYSSLSAYGPWSVCTYVPPVIYGIPPSCPIYPCRFVRVYGCSPSFVYSGYTSGYLGCYPYQRIVVYGTGYHYRPWIQNSYCPRPVTFGFAAHYSGYSSGWGFSFGLATGGGSHWVGHGPMNSGPWFGPAGYQPPVVHHDLRSDRFRRDFGARVGVEREVLASASTFSRPADAPRNDGIVGPIFERRHDVHPVIASSASIVGPVAPGSTAARRSESKAVDTPRPRIVDERPVFVPPSQGAHLAQTDPPRDAKVDSPRVVRGPVKVEVEHPQADPPAKAAPARERPAARSGDGPRRGDPAPSRVDSGSGRSDPTPRPTRSR